MRASVLALLAGSAAAQFSTIYTATPTADVAQAAATAKTSSPTSNVKGKVFDRMVIVWLENTDYDMAIGDPYLSQLVPQGITLSNYYGVTHPSEDNYVAAIAGDYFGMNNDDMNFIDANISTIIDLLDDKGISWGSYQEDMPYSGFQGVQYKNAAGANDYVRKHNPAIIFNNVANSLDRMSQIKNFTMFDKDLASKSLPQWSFVTPNMTSDGHDGGVVKAGEFISRWLFPLLQNEYFMKDTLVLVTFDENETYKAQNKVLGLLLGGAVPENLKGTTDSNYYNHYSEISTVEANWDLHTLGRWDVGANVFKMVADKTGDKVRQWSGATPLSSMFFNSSYAGVFRTKDNGVGPKYYPAPQLLGCGKPHDRTVLPSIVSKWKGAWNPTYYTNKLENNDGIHPPYGWA